MKFGVSCLAKAAPDIIHKSQVALAHPAAFRINVQAVEIQLITNNAVVWHAGADANKTIRADLMFLINLFSDLSQVRDPFFNSFRLEP